MRFLSVVTVIVNLLCITHSRTITHDYVDKRGLSDIISSLETPSNEIQNRAKRKAGSNQNRKIQANSVVQVSQVSGNTLSPIPLTQIQENQILDGVKKATEQQDVSSLLNIVKGILDGTKSNSEPLSATNLHSSAGLTNAGLKQTGLPSAANSISGNNNGDLRPPPASASLAPLTSEPKPISSERQPPNASAGKPCSCSCLCGSGAFLPNSLNNASSSAIGPTSQTVAGKGIISATGACDCACECPRLSFSDMPGMSSPNGATLGNVPAAVGPSPEQNPPTPAQAPSLSQPVIISQQTPSQSPLPAGISPLGQDPAAPDQIQGQTPSLTQPVIIAQPTPVQNTPPPVDLPPPVDPAANAANAIPAANVAPAADATPTLPKATAAPEPTRGPEQAQLLNPPLTPNPPIAELGTQDTQPAIAQAAQAAGAESKENPTNIMSLSLTNSLNLGNLVASPTPPVRL